MLIHSPGCAPVSDGQGQALTSSSKMGAAVRRDPPAQLQLAPEAQVRQTLQAEKDADKLKRTMKARMDFLDFE